MASLSPTQLLRPTAKRNFDSISDDTQGDDRDSKRLTASNVAQLAEQLNLTEIDPENDEDDIFTSLPFKPLVPAESDIDAIERSARGLNTSSDSPEHH